MPKPTAKQIKLSKQAYEAGVRVTITEGMWFICSKVNEPDINYRMRDNVLYADSWEL